MSTREHDSMLRSPIRQQPKNSDVGAFDPTEASTVVYPPNDYISHVGQIKSQECFNNLTERVRSMTTTEDLLNLSMMKTEEIEFSLEHITIDNNSNIEHLANNHKHHFIHEGYFNGTLFDEVSKWLNFETLKDVCYRYETKEKVDINTVMAKYEEQATRSTPYFARKGFTDDKAQAAAFALSFYTGTKSKLCNRAARLIANETGEQFNEQKKKQKLYDSVIIFYYLEKALLHIPYFWGYVTRTCNLPDNEMNLYVPGYLITWKQFSSSKKSKEIAIDFYSADQNTTFKIYSLTGRSIQEVSNNPEEDEVIFLPHSTFFVFKHEIGFRGTRTIYMREVDLGFGKRSILWVDHKIYNSDWENKRYMQTASTKRSNVNVHFIPKSSTGSALSFLRSPFGQRLKNSDSFRIITNMQRENEQPIHNADIRLIQALRQMGFGNTCMIFSKDKKKAYKVIESELNSRDREFVVVTSRIDDLESFVNFAEKTNSHNAATEVDPKSKDFREVTNQENESKFQRPNSVAASATPGTNVGKHPQIHAPIGNPTSMHNSNNTNIDILLENYAKRELADSRFNCVLIITGSFNPIHSSHLQNLLLVKQYLEHVHQPAWNVLAGYLSPTHDSYVHGKLGDAAWIPAKDRCRLCEQAIEYEGEELSSWVAVSRGECEWRGGFVDFGPVTENLRNFLNDFLVNQERWLKHPLRIVYVCGLDHFNKCSYLEQMAKQKNMACAVVFRGGYDEQQIRRSTKSTNVIYIPLIDERSKLVDVSSTQIRKYFENPTAGTKGIDDFIYPGVREYMLKKRKT